MSGFSLSRRCGMPGWDFSGGFTSGKPTKSYERSPFGIGKSTVNEPFSMSLCRKWPEGIIWLVVTGTWLDHDFPFSWECHHPNWLSLIYFSEGLVGQPPTRHVLPTQIGCNGWLTGQKASSCHCQRLDVYRHWQVVDVLGWVEVSAPRDGRV